MSNIKIPTYTPRDYQKPIWKLIQNHNKVMIMLSRRLGKSLSLLSIASYKMVQKPCSVLFLLPLAVQAKSVVWKGKTDSGLSLLDSIFPPSIVKSKNSTDMTLELFNGSILKVAGADNVDSLVGGNYQLIIMDEAAMIKEEVLAYLLPIVNANDGTIVINSTPRYGSWFVKMFNDDPNYQKYVCNITTANVFSEAKVETIKQEYIERYGSVAGLAYFNTEYMLDVQGVPLHAVYIGKIKEPVEPIEPTSKMYAAWDLGMNDSTVITFFEYCQGKMVIHSMVEGKGKTVQDYYNSLPYKVFRHYLPHDAGQVRGYVSSESASKVLKGLGANVRVLPRTNSVLDDINYIRTRLDNVVWLNKPAVVALRDKVLVYSNNNGKLDHCDYSDSFRYAVLGCRHIESQLNQVQVPFEESGWLDG